MRSRWWTVCGPLRAERSHFTLLSITFLQSRERAVLRVGRSGRSVASVVNMVGDVLRLKVDCRLCNDCWILDIGTKPPRV